MSNPTGTWQINANGHRGDLVISSVDAQGNLSGTVFGDPIVGFWNEGSQKITFARSQNATDPLALQVYTGFHFGANAPLFAGGPEQRLRSRSTFGCSRARLRHSLEAEGPLAGWRG